MSESTTIPPNNENNEDNKTTKPRRKTTKTTRKTTYIKQTSKKTTTIKSPKQTAISGRNADRTPATIIKNTIIHKPIYSLKKLFAKHLQAPPSEQESSPDQEPAPDPKQHTEQIQNFIKRYGDKHDIDNIGMRVKLENFAAKLGYDFSQLWDGAQQQIQDTSQQITTTLQTNVKQQFKNDEPTRPNRQKTVQVSWQQPNGTQIIKQTQQQKIQEIATIKSKLGVTSNIPQTTSDYIQDQPVTERLYRLIDQGEVAPAEKTQRIKDALARGAMAHWYDQDKILEKAQKFNIDTAQAPEKIQKDLMQAIGEQEYQEALQTVQDNANKFGKEYPQEAAALSKLSNDEKVALWAYTSKIFQDINGTFINAAQAAPELVSPNQESLSPESEKNIAELYSKQSNKDSALLAQTTIDAMAKLPRLTTTVHRTIMPPVSAAKQFAKGTDFYYPGITSTVDQKDAILFEQYTSLPQDKNLASLRLIMNINNGVRVGFFGVNAGDPGVGNEILVPPGTMFHIDSNMGNIDPSGLRLNNADTADSQTRLRNINMRQIDQDGQLINVHSKPTLTPKKPLDSEATKRHLEALIAQAPERTKQAIDAIHTPKQQAKPKTETASEPAKSGILSRLFSLWNGD